MKLVSIAERKQFRKCKFAKTQRFNCNTLIFNDIRFCIFVKSCKSTPKKPQKGRFQWQNQAFWSTKPTSLRWVFVVLASAYSSLNNCTQITPMRQMTTDFWVLSSEQWVVRGTLHFLFKLTTHCSKAQRHEFRPNVVAMAERILITVWMISFHVSLFFIRSLVKGLVFSLFYFGYWLLAFSH